ncbi:aldo/keto reductase [Actinomyces sp. MRS3W]|uniref:aldo/keto reductase n=1 Tax=Actinomyces sp. MRS3W TaxID=2800796 RepID=UPI0028FD204C|nr:aldo/keto reductase [Actinomyces sp. MRS3W]MDU0348797.1 aldo/keto reductase [Actinomyces sp. MRS3W]
MSTAIPSPVLPLRQGVSKSGPVAIPQLGFGTYKISEADAERAVTQALEIGYRHIDTAQMYGNEAGVGRALASAGIPREQLWVTSKLNNPNHRRDDALRSFDATMRDLQLEVLDLFLVHWPLAASEGIDLVDTWRTMIEILDSGRVRAIGVSNYQPEHLRTIIDATGVTPAVNQIELHPYLIQQDLRALNEELGIVTESWSPLGRGRLLEDPELLRLATELDVTPAQVIIRWHLQHGLVLFPKTTHADRMRINADVFGFELSQEQMYAIDALDRGMRTGSHPDQVQV